MDGTDATDAARCVIGLDVGGSKIAGGLVTFPGGQVVARTIIPTRAERGGEAVLADSLNLASDLLHRAQALTLSVESMGVCVCELVDLAGNVTSDKTIAWRGIDLHARFSTLIPTEIESDVRAAALAEALFGAAREHQLYAFVTVGTGISYTLVQAGKPYAGSHGNAMLIGNTPLAWSGEGHDSGAETLLEDIASGPALVSRYNRATSQTIERAEDVIAAAGSGDLNAVRVVKQGGQAMGVAIGLLINLLDPEAIVIGGGLGLSGGQYWQHMLETARRSIWSDTNRDLPIVKAALGTDAPIIGAATRAHERFSK